MSFLVFMGDEVDRLARRLDTAGDRMREVSRRMAGAEAGGAGSEALAAAAHEFSDSWSFGVGRLAEVTGGSAEYLRGAHRTFADVDEQLAAAVTDGRA